jgi:hypothetical protein
MTTELIPLAIATALLTLTALFSVVLPLLAFARSSAEDR